MKGWYKIMAKNVDEYLEKVIGLTKEEIKEAREYVEAKKLHEEMMNRDVETFVDTVRDINRERLMFGFENMNIREIVGVLAVECINSPEKVQNFLFNLCLKHRDIAMALGQWKMVDNCDVYDTI